MNEPVASMPEALPADRTDAVTVVVADDHRIVRDGIRLILETQLDVEVVGEAGDIEAAERTVRERRPALLLLDLNMPGGSSLELIPRVAEHSPETRIVVVTMQNDPSFADQALATGAHAYVLKESGGAELVQAIRLALSGETYVSPALYP